MEHDWDCNRGLGWRGGMERLGLEKSSARQYDSVTSAFTNGASLKLSELHSKTHGYQASEHAACLRAAHFPDVLSSGISSCE